MQQLETQDCKSSQERCTPELKELPPPLLRLGIETIQHIATFLPPSSASALALGCRRLKRIIGTQYWEKCNLRKYENEKHILLEFLSWDSPDEINCERCMRLHTVSLQPGSKRTCPVIDFREPLLWFFGDGFEFEHFQLAMKLHR
jgi:hypothetical protein